MDFKNTLLIICLFVGLNTFAQNRLEFNQVITYDTTMIDPVGPHTFNLISETLIVPAGKVWKMEYLSTHEQLSWWINDSEIPSFTYVTSTSNIYIKSAISTYQNKIWLKSGDEIYGRFDYICNNCGTQERSLFMSIIEFNTD